MDFEWTAEILPILDKLVSATSFGREQLEGIARKVSGRQRVLDLCIGFGNLAKCLVDEGKEVVGVDISQDSLDYARKKVGIGSSGRLTLVNRDIRALDYDGEFDAVTCVSSIWLDQGTELALDGAYRSLRKGGVICLTGCETNRQDKYKRIFSGELLEAFKSGRLRLSVQELQALNDFSQKYGSSASHEGSSEGLRQIAEKRGFRNVEIRPFYHETAYLMNAVR